MKAFFPLLYVVFGSGNEVITSLFSAFFNPIGTRSVLNWLNNWSRWKNLLLERILMNLSFNESDNKALFKAILLGFRQ